LSLVAPITTVIATTIITTIAIAIWSLIRCTFRGYNGYASDIVNDISITFVIVSEGERRRGGR